MRIYLRFVGNKSTMIQYTVLMPRLVNASKTQDNIRFCVAVWTKYKPRVTPPETSKLKTT